jgi:hypothetical protein
MPRNLSIIAARAIVAQVSATADCEGDFYATVDDDEIEFVACFETDWEGPITSDDKYGTYWETNCKLVGAYGENTETGERIAGNREEMIDLLGLPVVLEWEQYQSLHEMESGE